MRLKAHRSVTALQKVLEGWGEVIAVGLHSPGDDVYDPYFSLNLDVYTAAPLRDTDARIRAFGDVGAFESSSLTNKDRFLMGETPVRVEYKRVGRFDELVDAAVRGECLLRDGGTYSFYRVASAEPLLSRQGWLEALQKRLIGLPARFWSELRRSQEATAEHLYADLAAAAMRNDGFFFATSSGRFLSQICGLLFTINERFEPSPRTLFGDTLELPTIPESFASNMENFVDIDRPLSMSQRQELAQIMITGVLSL
ncbi:MAG: DUF4037 domain-containing protein [Spirochaetota bacterium]